MFDRFKRSFDLVKASARVLKQDKHLIVFPLISGAAMLCVIAGFALPVFGLHLFEGGERGAPLVYSVAFAFYVVQYFVIFFFNAALVGATMIRLDGGAPTLADGLRIAASRFPAILGYAIIAATVGMILRAIQERVGFLGRIVVALFGVGWTIATALVVPVLVARDAGPFASIKDSAALVKRTWGENAIGQGGMSLAFLLVHMAVFGLAAVLVAVGVWAASSALVVLAVALGLLAVLATLLLHSTLSGIYAAALYRYAANGSDSAGFDHGALSTAFQPKS